MDATEYDVIVIGAGPVGENVADRVVQAGLTAVVVESELVGGECSYWACMPSKALLRPVAALAAARSVAGSAQAAAGELDLGALFSRRDAFTHDWHDDSQVDWLAGAGIALARGRGRLVGPREVEVLGEDGSTRRLLARHAVAVCTGSDAAVPDLPGLAEAEPWTSRDATSASEVPPRLAVLGGGVVGVEMATLYAALGSEVTVVARSGLLPRMESFAGAAVERALLQRGGTVFRANVVSAKRTDPTTVLTLDDGSSVEAERVLVAAGRTPRTRGLGLDALGVDGVSDGDWLPVDDTMLVEGTDWLYGVGDVNHRALLTHQGKYQARAAGDVIAARALGRPVDDAPWGAHVATADHCAVPQVVFSDPQVASVGLTVAEAERAGRAVRAVDVELGGIAGAATHADGYRGTARAVIDTERGILVGATIVGRDVEELVQAVTIAVVGEVPLHRLRHAVPAYPTISELWLRWLEALQRAGGAQ